MKSFFFYVLLISVSFSFAEDQLEQKVLAYIYNAQWNSADSLLDEKIKTEPENPLYPFLKMQHYYYLRYWNNGQFNGDSLLELCADNANKTIELAEKIKESTQGKFYLGSAKGFLSRWHIRRAERWDAYWTARDAKNYLEEVIEEKPDFYDAYVELAVQQYFSATQLTGFIGALAWVAGMSGNRDLALQYFQKAAENGNLRKAEAQFALAAVYRFFENQYDESLIITSIMLEKYPDNPFLLNQQQQVTFLKDIEENGVQVLSSLPTDSLRTRYQIDNAGVLNNLGYNFINQSRLDDALVAFKLNIELYPDVANCYDSISECYQLMNDNENAVKFARIGLQKLNSDQTINEDFREQLRTIMQERIDDLDGEISI